MCRIFDEDQREKVAFYRNANASHGKEKKPMTHSRAKPYSAPPGSSQPVNRVSQPAGRGGGSGALATPAMPTRCGKCGKMSHFARECLDSDVTCFNYRGKGHLSTSCPHLRSGSLNNQSRRPRTTGRVFALSGADAAKSDDLIQGDMFLFANQVKASLREDARVYMILASMSVETKTPVSDIPLVREFPEVFDEVSGLPLERKVWTHIHSTL
ncbi:uncharacterized protein LOC114404897 [Glycine soja]|uniref:uncharacterized protein n=1 Tax=Glycine max TaxID=3847 RepID=UPI0003DEB8AA|nr:uncharacterized protein LOC102665216 [Glycine max]XP_028223447.1 uncharacterized protein LOC114404897 [Glycine soja]|eukprot:XP_006573990.1 uncharacterized protein LOC102665216 [Glycine max]